MEIAGIRKILLTANPSVLLLNAAQWERCAFALKTHTLVEKGNMWRWCVFVCIYICLPFVLFASQHILASVTLHPVIALGILLFSHTGEKNSSICFLVPVFANQWHTYWNFWD